MRAFQASQIPLPPETSSKFPRAPIVDLEIGCGVGFHPIHYARAHSDRVLIAIEHTREKFEKFARRIERHEALPNLIAIHANGVSWLTHRCPSASLDRLIFLYPNPCPKKGDLNKRWHGMPFMERAIDALKTGGELWLATNERFYYEEAKEAYARAWGLKLVEDLAFTRETLPYPQPRTHFEKKYLERGETCFNLKFKKDS